MGKNERFLSRCGLWMLDVYVVAPRAIDAMHKMFIIHRSFVFLSVTVIYLNLMLGALCISECLFRTQKSSFVHLENLSGESARGKRQKARGKQQKTRRMYVFLRAYLDMLSNDESHNVSAVLPFKYIFCWLLFLAFPFFVSNC